MFKYLFAILLVPASMYLYAIKTSKKDSLKTESTFTNKSGNIIKTRFILPEGFERIKDEKYSFGEYLRNLPLKPDGSPVKYFNGKVKTDNVHSAVIDFEVGNRDLQQCADACIRLRSEYLFQRKRYEDIHFNFTNGWRADYSKWMEGHRISVIGNKCTWQKTRDFDNSYPTFRKYLDQVFSYAGTISLSREMSGVSEQKVEPGNVFIQGGSPGHAAMVVDVAENQRGERIFLLAQSYMPAQEIHVLKNHTHPEMGPWFKIAPGEPLYTPEWTFPPGALKKF